MKDIKTIIALAFAVVCLNTNAHAAVAANMCPQNQKGKAEAEQRQEPPRFNPREFEEKLRNFIITEAGLTQQEADKARPVYLAMKDKQRDYRSKIIKASKRLRKEQLTEKDCERILREIEKMTLQTSQVEVECNKQLRNLGIPASKIIRIKDADERFGRRMFHEMKNHKKHH